MEYNHLISSIVEALLNTEPESDSNTEKKSDSEANTTKKEQTKLPRHYDDYWNGVFNYKFDRDHNRIRS